MDHVFKDINSEEEEARRHSIEAGIIANNCRVQDSGGKEHGA